MTEHSPSEEAVRAAMTDQPATVDNDAEAVREELARQRGADVAPAEGDESPGAPAGP